MSREYNAYRKLWELPPERMSEMYIYAQDSRNERFVRSAVLVAIPGNDGRADLREYVYQYVSDPRRCTYAELTKAGLRISPETWSRIRLRFYRALSDLVETMGPEYGAQ